MQTRILIVLFLFLSLGVRAQRFEIGSEFGCGRVGSQNTYPYSSVFKLSDNSKSESYRTGFLCFYTPDSAMFSIKTGILYNRIVSRFDTQEIKDLEILQIPVECDIRFGQKYYFTGGVGMGFNYLISPKTENRTFPVFQLVLNANIGLGLKITNLLSLDVKYQLGYDITRLYSIAYPSHFGSSTEEDIYSYNGLLCLGLRYRIK